MTSLFDRAASVLERRFLKNAFLPVMLFFPAAIAPYMLEAHSLAAIARGWQQQPAPTKLVEVAGYLAVVWFLAGILASQWGNIIRMFEGYPLSYLPRLEGLGTAWHKRRQEECAQDERLWSLVYFNYPSLSADVLPTRLGNILRSGERYAFDRYRADPIILWPRLYHLVPREAMDDVEDARSTLEFLLVVALWFTGFAVVNLVVLATTGAPVAVLAACFGGGILIAYAAYVSALPAAVEYSEQIKAVTELYRLDLMDRLRMTLPDNRRSEQQSWTRISNVLGKGVPDEDLAYTSAPRSVPGSQLGEASTSQQEKEPG